MPTFDAIQQEIAAMLDVADEDLTDEQKKAMDAYLDELGAQEAEKIDSFAAFIRQEAARVKFLKDEAARLTSKARTAENRIAWLKGRYASILHDHGLKGAKGQCYSLTLRQSQRVEVDPAAVEELPRDYRKIKMVVEADKSAIGAALKEGKIIPGCRLVTSASLQIR